MIDHISLKELVGADEVSVMPFSLCQAKHQDIPDHRHDFYELIFILDGAQTQKIDNQEIEISNGQVIFVSPFNVHSLEGSVVNSGIVIAFDETILYRTEEDFVLLQNIISGYALNRSRVLNQGSIIKIHTYIDLLRKEIQSAPKNKEIVYSLLKIILLLTQNEFEIKPSSHPNADSLTFYNFLNILNEKFSEEHTVQYYADALGITALSLNKIAKKQAGRNTLALIHVRLVQEAKRLLAYTDKKSKTIAFELGFIDESYFSKFFKKHTQFSPQQYKANLHET